MRLLTTGIIFMVAGVVVADVASEFKAAKIDPDIIDKVPNESIDIKYGKKEIKLGDEITPTESKDIPEVHYKHEGGVLYTLVMTDPDIPVRGYNREWQHWVVGNIPEDKVPKGEVLTEYIGPAPPKNTGLHRYVFLLFKQNQGSITFDERRIGNRDKRRNRFSVKKFAEKYNLEGPIAGNFMKAQYDDYVPIAHKQIGIY
ncbi:PREDICTED: protein D2-like [Ceratosolen solmsi marchali]|uniref:Protein D2-like n=1 Tax=Ceratosolen solmsi marchali TaxID=326594 RepID=A0AAJ6YC75_9HYME|nr:PREDICTED: protein D2-like [Ceratosolen solmsi marchali]